MDNNVLIAIIAVSGVIISTICILGGAIFAYITSNKSINQRLDKIDHTLEVIQGDMVKWSEQIFKIKAHIKLD